MGDIMKKSNDDRTIQYGAKELKKFIEKSTVWAINIAISIFATVFLLSSALNLFDKGVDVVIEVFDADTIPLIDYDKIKVKDRKPKVIEQKIHQF